MVQSLIPEVVDILNECFDLLPDVALPGLVLLRAKTTHLISGQGLTQDLDQRPVS